MNFSLENDQCRVTVNSFGAELSSFIRKDFSNLEYIWQADPAVWARHAPVLFPIVGRLPLDTYLHEGKEYKLPQHGFARDQQFVLLSQTSEELIFGLKADENTRPLYPFDFELIIRYQLRGNTLVVSWQVNNLNKDHELLFSIGAHPAFRCPLLPDEQFEDYYFEFDHAVSFERHLLTGGLLTGQTQPVLNDQTELPLTYELFADDALVLKKFDFTHLTLRSRKSERAVRLRFDGFPYLGLWTKGPGAAFVCVEPWQGVASTMGGPQELAEKEGILNLPPSKGFTTEYSITVE
jgi:galactose mutarotase-like enzyme